MAFTGSSDTAELYFNATQPDFGGESLTLLVSWGDGSSSTLTGDAPYNFTADHTYASTGTYTVTATLENNPDPSSHSLSSLAISSIVYTYTIAVYPSPFPKPLAQLETGDHIYLNFSTLHDIVHEVTLKIDGSAVDSWVINSQTGSLEYNPSTYAGKTGFKATWVFDGANYSYSVEYGAPFYPLYTSNYLVATFSNSELNEYPIGLTNSGSNATGTYQQMVTVSSSSIGYENNSAWSNIQFTYGNGTVIYSWLQSVNSTSATYWLKLNSIPAGGSQTIYIQPVSKTESLFNGYTVGEAPQLSSTYAQYDNGKIVFGKDKYYNFAGTTLNSNLSYINQNSTITIDNGLTITQPASDVGYAWIMTPALPSGQIIEIASETGDSEINIRLGWSTSENLGAQNTPYNSYDNNLVENGGALNGVGITSSSAFGISTTPTVNTSEIGIYYFAWLNNGSQYYGYNGTTATSSNTTNTITSSLYGYIGIGTFSYATTSGIDSRYIPYMLIRPYISMPTYTIGSGIPYLANSTTLDRVFYSYTSNYPSDPLYQIYTYDIPDSFSDNYISLYSNASWTYESSSGYSTFYPSVPSVEFAVSLICSAFLSSKL